MKKLSTSSKNTFHLIVFLLASSISQVLFSATITTTGSGNWSSTTPNAPWPGGTIPATGDNIVVGVGYTLTVDANRTCNAITFGGSSGTLSVNSSTVLTVTTSITLNNLASSNTSCTLAGAGTINCVSIILGSGVAPTGLFNVRTQTMTSTIANINISGDLTLNSIASGLSLNLSNSTFNASSGTITISGSIITSNGNISNTSAINMNTGSGNATLVLGGNTPFNLSGTGTNTVTLNGTSTTVNYSSNGAQTVLASTYTNLTLSGSGNKTTTGVTVNGTLSMQGTAVAITSSPTYGTSAILEYKGSGAQTTSSIEFPATLNAALLINNALGVTLNAGKTVNGTITITTGTLNTNNLALALGNTYSLSVASGATLNAGTTSIGFGTSGSAIINGTLKTANTIGLSGLAGATINSTNSPTLTIGSTSTIEFNSSSDQFITNDVLPYGNIVLSTGGTKTVAGNITIYPGSTFTLNTGVVFNNGTRNIQNSAGTGTVTFNINGTFLTSLAAGFSGGNTAINGTGTTINLGASSVIHYTKSSAQSVSSRSDYAIVRLSGGATKTMDGNVTINDSLDILDADLSIASNTLTINGKIGGAGTLTGSTSSNITIGGSATNAALSFTQTSSATRTINTFTLNRSTGATLNNSLDISGILTLTNGPLLLNGQTLTLNGTISTSSGTITGSLTSNISVGGTGSLGSLFFTSGGQMLNNFTLNRTTSGNATLGTNLSISGTTAFTNGKLIIGSNTLTINGDITGMNTSNCFTSNGSSNINIGGSGALTSSLFFDQTTSGITNRLINFTYNRSSQTITLGNTLEIIGSVTPTAGTLASAGNLTLVSLSTGTGNILQGSGTYITGKITAQRYIPSIARRWRFMSSPLSNATLEDWRGEIYITGAGTGNTAGTLNSNGFDATVSNPAGIYSYNESISGVVDNGWTAVTNNTSSLTNVSLGVGTGYRVFVRGDRSDIRRLEGLLTDQNEVTMDLRGTVNTGDITMPVSYTNTGSSADDGWCLVGNPYPCQYDWDAFWDAGNSGNSGTYYSNIYPTIYVYDPNSNSYKSYNASANTGTLTSGIITQGQSFFIQSSGTSPSMTFKEQFKSTTTPLALFKTADSDNEMHIRLKRDAINYDDYILKFMSSATKGYDQYDILKIAGSVNISSYAADHIYLSADVRQYAENDTIFLNITGKSGDFNLTFNHLPRIDNQYYYLEDDFLGTTNLLSESFVYPFTINTSNTATFGSERFKIIVNSTFQKPSSGIKKTSIESAATSVWPNPAKASINIQSQNVDYITKVELFTIEGKCLLSDVINSPSNSPTQINVAHIPTGIYFLQVNHNNSTQENIKIAIEE